MQQRCQGAENEEEGLSTYTMCFQLLFRRMARYMGLLREKYSIYPTVGIVKHSKNIFRYDSVLLNRLRTQQSTDSELGHSCLTHSYLLSGDDLSLIHI